MSACRLAGGASVSVICIRGLSLSEAAEPREGIECSDWGFGGDPDGECTGLTGWALRRPCAMWVCSTQKLPYISAPSFRIAVEEALNPISDSGLSESLKARTWRAEIMMPQGSGLCLVPRLEQSSLPS